MLVNWRILLLLLAFLSIAAEARADRFDAARDREALLVELTAVYEAGDPARVISALTDSLPPAGFTPRLHNLLGLALAAEGRHSEAVEAYEAGLKSGGDRLFELHVNLGLSLQALGIGGRAMAEFERAVALAPQELEARLALGEGYIDYRRYSLARNQLEEAARLAPGDPRVLRQRARLADETGEGGESLALWVQLEQLVPDADTARRLGELHAEEEPEAAIGWYQRCANRDPSALDCASVLGSLLLARGEDEEALFWLRRAEEGGIASSQLIHNLLLGCQRSGQVDSLELVVSRHELQRADSWGVVALARRGVGRLDDALFAAERAHFLAPEDPELTNILAVLLHELGRSEEARELWRKILESHPEHAQARSNLTEASK